MLVIIAATWFADAAPRRLLVIAAVATVVPIGTLIVLFPEGGWFPFTAGSLVLLTAAVVGAGWCGRAVPLVRWAAITYGVVIIGAFVVKSPLGGNVVRLGWLAAGPAAALTLKWHRRTVVPAIVAASLAWNAAYIPLAFKPADRTASADYYDTLVSYLDTLPQPLRIEVVPTQTFAQADTLALRIDGIARGWETQLDRELNPEFYTGRLDAETYHRWLLEHAVSIVALPLGKLRDVSLDEAAVIRGGPSYLREVWQNDDWQVYAVADASPLADNGTTVVDVQPDELTIKATRTGWTTLKFRFTDLYEVSEGDACLAPTDEGWIDIFVRQPGRIRLSISLSIDAVFDHRHPRVLRLPCPAKSAGDDGPHVHDAVRVERLLQLLEHRIGRAVFLGHPLCPRLADAVVMHDRASEPQRLLADDRDDRQVVLRRSPPRGRSR